MKTPRLHLFLLAAFCAVFTPAALRAQVVAGNELVRIEVRVQTSQDRKGSKGSRVDTVTQHKTLNILLSGKARNPESRKGKWQAYARDVKDNTLIAIDSGNFDVDLSKGPQKVESAVISTTYTPEHSTGGGSGNNRNRNTTKKVAAEGKKFVGYGITITDGEKQVGEYFDPPGLKAEVNK